MQDKAPLYSIHTFTRKYFDEYQLWFQDRQFKRFLECIDQEWLNYIIHQTNGKEWILSDESDKLWAIIGLVFPTVEDPWMIITNLATNPSLQRKGLGKLALKLVMQEYPSCHHWKCFIHRENIPAIQFFRKSGWNSNCVINENDLLTFKYERK